MKKLGGSVSGAVREMVEQRALCVDGSAEANRLDELIKLAGSSADPTASREEKGMQRALRRSAKQAHRSRGANHMRT